MGACADALRELRGIANRLSALDSFGAGNGLESEQANVVRLVQNSPCEALKALAPHVQHDQPERVLLAWQALVVNGLETTEPTLPKVATIRAQSSGGTVRVISTSETTVNGVVVPMGAPGATMNPWIDHARRVVAVLIARVERIANTEPSGPPTVSVSPDLLQRLEAGIAAVGSIGSNFDAGMARVGRVIESLGVRDDVDTPAATLPELGPRDREAWQASLIAGMTQEKIADAMNKAHPGENWTQPRVSEAIKRAKAHAEASGLANKVSATPSRAPARTLDPAAADSGQRTDGRSRHLRDKARQIAKEE